MIWVALLIIGIFWLIGLSNKKVLPSNQSSYEQELHADQVWESRHYAFLDEVDAGLLSVEPFLMRPSGPIKRGVVFLKGENLIIDAPVFLHRKMKTGSQWHGGHRGVRVTPFKGMSFNVGGMRGYRQATTKDEMEMGYITLTTKRIIFTGDGQIRFAVPLIKVNNATLDGNVIHFDVAIRDYVNFYSIFTCSEIASKFSSLMSNFG